MREVESPLSSQLSNAHAPSSMDMVDAVLMEENGEKKQCIDYATRKSAQRMVGFLVAVNFFVWAITLIVSSTKPGLLSLAILAYTFGLRHAVDADHIAAIDNVTRVLLQQGAKSVAVGFYFAIGHSTVVFIVSVAVIFSSNVLADSSQSVRSTLHLIGACLSASFLLLIGVTSMVLFIGLYHQWRYLQSNNDYKEHIIQRNSATVQYEQDLVLNNGSCSQYFQKMFKLVDKPWKMYPLGLLFGISFDTSTEVALLGVSAITAQNGADPVVCLILPALFASGMCLIDTLDGIFMLWAYGYAMLDPLKKIFYNMFLTATSGIVALLIGIIETMEIVRSELNLSGSFWDVIAEISENFEIVGYITIGVFLIAAIVAYVYYQYYFLAFERLPTTPS